MDQASNEYSSETKHVEYLDGWRGCSILLLLAGHFSLIPSIAGHSPYTGRLGVECFFVLSGRLMAEILFVRNTPLKLFYYRRVSRIFPALWVFVCTMFLLAHMFSSIDVNWISVVTSLTFISNYFPSSGTLGHTWSLCVEEHGYLLLSVIALLQRRKRVDVLVFLTGVSLVACLNGLIQTWVLHRGYYQVYWHSDVRVFSITVSAALYLYFRETPPKLFHPAMPVAALLIALPLSVLGFVPDPIKYSVGTFLLAFGLITLDKTWPFVLRVLGNPALTYFGIWSFSLYLWQQPFYLYFSEQKASKIWIIALLFCVSLASFCLVEKPVRNFLNLRFKTLSRRLASAM